MQYSSHRIAISVVAISILLTASGCGGTWRRSSHALWGGSDSSYVVRRGDTFYSIARQHNLTVQQLARANHWAHPEDLPVGLKLTIPEDPSGPSSLSRAPAQEKSVFTKSDGSEAPPRTALGRPLQWPLTGHVITSPFGMRDGHPHDGIDIRAPKGTAVEAAADGEVVFADRHGGYGNLVILRHHNGLLTIYAHADELLVRKGQQVKAGDTISRVGETGHATGPHLHFEVRRGAHPEDPLLYLPP